MKKNILCCFFVVLLLVLLSFRVEAEEHSKTDPDKVAIVLASFGTTVPSAVKAIANIQEEVEKAFPGVPVRLTFTSNIIRSVWRKRQSEPDMWLDKGIPKDILYVKNLISVMGELREEGYRNVIVQPTHMFFMEQARDLKAYVDAFASIRTMRDKWMPFKKVVMGRPALGGPSENHDYHDDIKTAIETLSQDVALAREREAALVYMGHGNERWSTGIYMESAKMMRSLYPDVVTYVGAVEGFPGIGDITGYLSRSGTKKIVLKPFMIVAGDHANNDMAGDEEDSWKNILTKEGFEVMPVLQGLGSNDKFAKIFVDHIKDAARDNGIVIK